MSAQALFPHDAEIKKVLAGEMRLVNPACNEGSKCAAECHTKVAPGPLPELSAGVTTERSDRAVTGGRFI